MFGTQESTEQPPKKILHSCIFWSKRYEVKFVHSPYWFRSVSTFFTEIFPHLINQVGGAHQHTHLLEMSFSVHTINYAPYYLCTFDKIKTGRNVRFVDMKLPWKKFLKEMLDSNVSSEPSFYC